MGIKFLEIDKKSELKRNILYGYEKKLNRRKVKIR